MMSRSRYLCALFRDKIFGLFEKFVGVLIDVLAIVPIRLDHRREVLISFFVMGVVLAGKVL